MTKTIFAYLTIFISTFILFFILQGYGSFKKLSFQDAYYVDNNLDKSFFKQLNSNFLNSSEIMLSAKRFFYDEQFKLAIECFNFFINNYPDQVDSSVYAFLAESNYETNQIFTSEIISLIDKSLYLDPSDTRALSLNGLRFFKERKFKDALKNWSIALENSSNLKEKESLILAMNLALKELNK